MVQQFQPVPDVYQLSDEDIDAIRKDGVSFHNADNTVQIYWSEYEFHDEGGYVIYMNDINRKTRVMPAFENYSTVRGAWNIISTKY